MNSLLLSEELRVMVRRFAADFNDHRRVQPRQMCWEMLHSCGTRLWLDTGDVQQAAAIWNPDFEALTTNNTLLNLEIQKGIYDRLMEETGKLIMELVPDLPEDEIVQEIAFVLNAVHGLRLVNCFGGFVSVELHTALADDVEGSVAYGLRFHEICPEKFIVKIPYSPAGLIAAGRLKRLGVAVNFTLGFSARQNYLAALFADPSYVNVFMGRLNALVADNHLGTGCNVGERATLETQRQLTLLRNAGQSSSCLIGASIRDAGQMQTLAGIDVMTIPPKVAQSFSGSFANRIESEFHSDLDADYGENPGFETLWDVSHEFSVAVFKLRQIPVMQLTPERLIGNFKSTGFGDLFPRWSKRDINLLRSDGKIPVYSKWRQPLANLEVGIDSLMTEAAFQAFSNDQLALDERIRRHLV